MICYLSAGEVQSTALEMVGRVVSVGEKHAKSVSVDVLIAKSEENVVKAQGLANSRVAPKQHAQYRSVQALQVSSVEFCLAVVFLSGLA